MALLVLLCLGSVSIFAFILDRNLEAALGKHNVESGSTLVKEHIFFCLISFLGDKEEGTFLGLRTVQQLCQVFLHAIYIERFEFVKRIKLIG